MKLYESPSCEVDILVQEKSFMVSNTPISDDLPVNPSHPFNSRAYGLWEEDEDE